MMMARRLTVGVCGLVGLLLATGCQNPDPLLGLTPLSQPTSLPTTAVLSNSFGFGGSNCSLILSRVGA